MEFLAVMASLCLLASCGGDSDHTEELRDPEAPVDTTGTAGVGPEADIEESSYSTVEDYGRILSKDQLVAEFGAENLVDGESWYAEGTVRFDNSVLTDPDNGQVVKYVWEDDGNTLNHIEVCYYIFDEDYSILGTQVIVSECGVSTGMSLQALRDWNGSDFDFFGFGWDYEGGILVEEGSEIAECPVQIKLSFDLEEDIPAEHMGMYSDQVFNTADDIAQGVPVLVDLLTYRPAED
ncbi:MAG: hypothetical protein JXK93_12160 [Sphaerochaetaceae bacterium]|nr:hypothetical protein [Sphaerochaetaceae bacterium]